MVDDAHAHARAQRLFAVEDDLVALANARAQLDVAIEIGCAHSHGGKLRLAVDDFPYTDLGAAAHDGGIADGGRGWRGRQGDAYFRQFAHAWRLRGARIEGNARERFF